jgi:hypothetical protein
MTSVIWLIVLAVVIPIIVFVFSFYLLVYFQHPEDRSTAYLPKIVVVSGLSIWLVLSGLIMCGFALTRY